MRKILISGASIAGPALAFGLVRHGFDVTLIERAPAMRTGGYAVDVRGAALNVLSHMGLLEDARRLATDTLGTSFIDRRGRTRATVDRGFGVIDAEDVEIMRGDFVRLLSEATQRDAVYRYGENIVALEQHEGGVDVRFESGRNERFDLVIGADGTHSNVRRLVFGDESQFVRHLGGYMAIFTAPNHLGLDRWQLMLNLPGRVISVKSTQGNRSVVVTAFFSSVMQRVDHRDVAAHKQMVSEAFAGAGWEVPRLLAAMHDAPDFYFDSTCQIRMPEWSRDRVTLVGDACVCPSPMTGQGTSLALIGAYVLAGELATARGDHRVAFPRYESLMREFAARNQDQAADIAKNFAPGSAFAIWFRNLNIWMLHVLPFSDRLMKFAMRRIAQVARAIELEDYGPDADSFRLQMKASST